MKNVQIHWHPVTYAMAFLIGAILFLSVGKDWLLAESNPILLAGLIGVAVSVLAFCAWNLFHHPPRQK
jgi:peptidoglycan/LPS O-acetylase OafA/YrhL